MDEDELLNQADICFDELLRIINDLDLSNKTKDYLKDILEKDIKRFIKIILKDWED